MEYTFDGLEMFEICCCFFFVDFTVKQKINVESPKCTL